MAKSEPVGGGAERTDLFVVERNNGEWVNACDGTDYSCFLSLSEAEEALKAEADNCEEGESLYRIVRFTRVGASLSAPTPPTGELKRTKCPKCDELLDGNGLLYWCESGHVFDAPKFQEAYAGTRNSAGHHQPSNSGGSSDSPATPTVRAMALEIANISHYAWTDPKNAEYLFREIEKRAQKISSLGGAVQDGDCPCGATVVRKSDSANKSKLCADCAAQEEAPRSEWRAGMKEAAQIADHFANDELSVVEWPEYGLMARDRRCDSGMTGVMGERIAAAIRAKLTPGVVAEEEATSPRSADCSTSVVIPLQSTATVGTFCPHINKGGHESEIWCLDCGKRWPNTLMRAFYANAPTIALPGVVAQEEATSSVRHRGEAQTGAGLGYGADKSVRTLDNTGNQTATHPLDQIQPGAEEEAGAPTEERNNAKG